VLVADYGRGVAASAGLRSAIAARARSAPVVWDPHPRGPAPVAGVRLATPNLAEAQLFAPEIPAAAGLRVATAGAAVRAEWLRGHWSAGAVAVTLGGGGALLAREGRPALHIPATPARGDTCGAGDRFASAAAGALLGGAPLAAAVSEAVAAASRYVAADGPAGLEPQPIAAVEAR
jgi:bifunctional ADP-heptose synthase (sugar kinase/adenylyltransferase)